MSVKIRLARVGKAHQISYRIVATDTRGKRDSKYLEILGFYNPYNKPELVLNREKLALWTQKGAKPTQAVENLIKLGHLVKRTSKRKVKQESQTQTETKPTQEPTMPLEATQETPAQETKQEQAPTTQEEKPNIKSEI